MQIKMQLRALVLVEEHRPQEVEVVEMVVPVSFSSHILHKTPT
jgi:hypothetical protein